MDRIIQTIGDKMSKKLFIVDTISTFRMRYVIEADELVHAFDEVTMNGSPDYFEELTQKNLGETIVDGRQISREEFDKMIESLKTDDDELSSYWMGDKMIRKINYTK